MTDKLVLITSKGSIEVKVHLDYEPETNPLQQDGYHMGHRIGKSQYMLFHSHATEEAQYVIIVNERTGESVKVYFK